MIALTFDAGADRGYAERILNTLRDTGVKASFGMTGKWAEQNPDLVRRMVAEGHLLINHTYDHASFTGASTGTTPLTEAQLTAELEDASTAITNVGAPKPTLYRPPYGDINAYYDLVAQKLGYRIVMPWGTPKGNIVDSQDWTGISSATIAANVI